MVSGRYRWDIPKEFIRDLDREAKRRLGPAAEEIARAVVEIAIDIADAELVNDRPDVTRRNRATTRGKPHYIDSFEVGAPDLSGGRVRVLVRNTSPVADGIEYGSAAHWIRGPGKFPMVTSTLGGGNYASDAGEWWLYGSGTRPPVFHPGKPGGYKIVRRAFQEQAAKTGDITVAVTASLKQ